MAQTREITQINHSQMITLKGCKRIGKISLFNQGT